MKISYFDLNIEKGEYLDSVISFVKQNDFDILAFQEVGGKQFSDYDGKDIFEVIKTVLGYEGELAINLRIQKDYDSYYGNAIFYKKEFSLIEKKVLWMKDYVEIDSKETFPFKEYARNALSLVLEKEGKQIEVVCTHLAWSPSPKDTDYKIAQGKILYNYVKSIKNQYILSGDFNVDKSSQVVQSIDSVSRNLAVEYNIENTLNPNLHQAKQLFPPGLAVDFVYVGNKVTVHNFELVEKDLSDHYGFSALIEV